MKAKKKILTAATLSAFLALAGAVQAQNTGGDKTKHKTRTASGKKATRYKRGHRSGKKSHKRHKRTKHTGGTTPPPK